jgi:integrase
VRGVKLGNPNGARVLRGKQVGNKQAVAAIKAQADERAENLRAIMADVCDAGHTSVRDIAAELNRRAILTPRGGEWHATSPVGTPLKTALEAASRCSTIMLTNKDGHPWTSDGFRASWRKACAAAGVVGVTFNDLRGTAVTRLALAQCTEAEIATITGHSLRDVRSILDAHYLHRDPALAESAIRKLEKGTKTPN